MSASGPMQPDFAAYERAARDRVTALDGEIDAETFAVAFNAFRLSTWLLQDFETNVYRPHGLSLAGFRLLFTLWTLGDLPPAEVARLAGVTKAAVSACSTRWSETGSRESARRPTPGG
ncbi:MAG: MarR family winged helix-turn-helix transcriptional regulator [Ilumatobacteraceae bacterium]